MTMSSAEEKKLAHDDDERTIDARVVIVGAGASGLQCAYSLVRDHGYAPKDIVILEARHRVGGRILSSQETRTTIHGERAHFMLDHGAAWVHGTGYEWGVPLDGTVSPRPTANPMMKLLQEATPNGESVYDRHLNCVVKGNPWMRPQHVLHHAREIRFYADGELLETDSVVVSEALKRHFAIMDTVSDAGNDFYEERRGMDTVKCSLEEMVNRVVDAVTDDLGNLTDRQRELVQALTPFFYKHLIECWYGSATSQIQMCEFIDDPDCEDVFDETYSEEGDFYGPHCTLKRGMVSVLEPILQSRVKDQIFLNQKVVHIQDLDDHVSVETATGLRVVADVCVVTMTTGCLAYAAQPGGMFVPELSSEKLKAIQSTKMGSYKKIFLTFDSIFWPAKEAFIGMVRRTKAKAGADPLGKFLLFDNLWARTGIPCIEAVLFGDSGTWATHRTTEEIRNAVIEFMSDSMGRDDVQERCIDCHVTRWEEDPYSRGAYSSVALGASLRHVEGLRKPEWNGRLIISGEATVTEFEGSVHAALFSGKNAAEIVQAYFPC